jgi:prevent-host-death family protein
MTKLSTHDVRSNLSEVLDQVRTRRERILVQRNGRDVAALIPIADLKLLERLEDGADIREARRALAEEERIPWGKVKSRLGLK